MNVYLKELILGFLFYFLVFVFPIIIYLYKVEKLNPFEYLKLTNNPLKGILTGATISVIYISLLILKNITLGLSHINFNIGVYWISGIMVGFLEEIPARGFLLQKLTNKMNFWLANILTTFIFVSIHIPTWINSNANIMQSFITTAMVSLVFGYLFKEYKSLWTTIICHSVFNLCVWIGL